VGDAHVTRPFELEGAHAQIQATMSTLVGAGITPISIGGDHSVTLPILRALACARQGKAPLSMIHIDAHCDTGDDYGGSRFHHGAPFKIAVDEGLIEPTRTIQIGIRGSLAFEGMWDFSQASGMRVMDVDECYDRGSTGVLAEIHRVVGRSPAYLSFDIDALDPAFAPGTGTPEVGGLTTHFAQQLIRGLGVQAVDIVGADLVEVSPPFDVGDITSLAGANLMFEILCVVAQARARRGGLI
jgi:guanidinopropionase